MIFRAIFWIAVVAILMPREPDLGLGRPGATAASVPSAILARVEGLIASGSSGCQDREMACAAASGAAGELKSTAFQSLAQVKAEIEEAKRERLAAR